MGPIVPRAAGSRPPSRVSALAPRFVAAVNHSYTSPPVADLPLDLDPQNAARLLAALDVEGKVLRALDALGPIAGRDVVAVGCGEGERKRLEEAGARLTCVEPLGAGDAARWPLADRSADTIVSVWSGFRGADPGTLAEADRVLRPEGRLLVVHDYGRDDVSTLRGDLPEYGVWSRRDGPFLTAGFRIRVIHCWWSFESLEDARSFLAAAFGEAGRQLGERLRRPRISHKVAVYHRTRGEA
jgi:SAM-dependent methyltransferase